jgi:prepilin-type N-terminal cleavage/methylation domain-containing protein
MRGFTLIEIMVAVCIIALAGMLTGTMLQATALARHIRYEDLATKIASNQLESLRAARYVALPATGSFSNALLTSLPSGTGSTTITVINSFTKQITVGVSWKDPGRSNTSYVGVTTLMTQYGGL